MWMVTQSDVEELVHPCVTCRIGLLQRGFPDNSLKGLRLIQTAAARVQGSCPKRTVLKWNTNGLSSSSNCMLLSVLVLLQSVLVLLQSVPVHLCVAWSSHTAGGVQDSLEEIHVSKNLKDSMA